MVALTQVQQLDKLKVEGAQCDGTPLTHLQVCGTQNQPQPQPVITNHQNHQVDRLACDQGDYLLVIAALGGVMAFLIIIVRSPLTSFHS